MPPRWTSRKKKQSHQPIPPRRKNVNEVKRLISQLDCAISCKVSRHCASNLAAKKLDSLRREVQAWHAGSWRGSAIFLSCSRKQVTGCSNVKEWTSEIARSKQVGFGLDSSLEPIHLLDFLQEALEKGEKTSLSKVMTACAKENGRRHMYRVLLLESDPALAVEFERLRSLFEKGMHNESEVQGYLSAEDAAFQQFLVQEEKLRQEQLIQQENLSTLYRCDELLDRASENLTALEHLVEDSDEDPDG